MLKKIMNLSEAITYKQTQEICERNGAVAYPKVRLADILPIENSGISDELFKFALASHFDVIVTNREGYPLSAVEFDGVQHVQSPKQIERDKKKDALCERFDMPLLRINTEYLNDYYRQMNLLSWCIETWFALQWFSEAQENGQIPYDEPFMPTSFNHIPGYNKDFPLWLSRDALGRIAKLHEQNVIVDMSPSTIVWNDKSNNEYHSLAWVLIDENRAVLTTANIKGQNFPISMVDVVEDIALIQLYNKLVQTLDNEVSAVSPEAIDQAISDMEAKKYVLSSLAISSRPKTKS
ncbi:DUF2726 domain-containing protein [Alicyclobacillus tolerans]|uniref:DUF2726 domain-containing protein n=1 Tax=Alicyclobacillus tolerans TaxID=90970 RepID=A0A1M6U9N7_9BACL|nr:DUF2726 domain-containing protein [Alicyclobacillus montanus]SHK65975.1 Protein of unknown function [Alicyclobacillus montanus]